MAANPGFTLTGFAFPVFSSASCDYPSEDDVRDGVVYSDGDFTGNLTLPDEGQVLEGVGYGSLGTEFTGTLTVPSYRPPPPFVPPAPQSSPFAAILYAVLSRLSEQTGIDAAYIRPVANDEYTVTITEPMFCYIRPFQPYPQDGQMNAMANGGAGRLAIDVDRRIRIYIYTRSGVDTYSTDNIALLGNDPSRLFSDTGVPGQFAAEELVLNALANWMPLDGNGEALCISPVRWEFDSGPPVRQAENEEGLIRSHLDFGISYVLAISPTEPPP